MPFGCIANPLLPPSNPQEVGNVCTISTFNRSFNRCRELNTQTEDEPAEKAAEEASDARCDAIYLVLKTVPTTLAGMRAKIDWAFSTGDVSEYLLNSQGEDDHTVQQFVETLFEAARLLAARSA
jgi:hypothetical protein